MRILCVVSILAKSTLCVSRIHLGGNRASSQKRAHRTISFYDDLFAVNKQRLERLADLLSSTGVNRNLRFTCSLRANVVTRDLVELLKRINIVSVGMGLESGSDRTLSFLKGNVTVSG